MANTEVMAITDLQVRIMELEKDASTAWHHHTTVDDFFVCLTGRIQVESPDPKQAIVLNPGERAEIKSPRVHRVVNLHPDLSEYLLVQGIGCYDFIKDRV